MFTYYDPTIILLIPAVIFTFYAQAKVSRAYSTYLKVRNRKGISGAEAARIILDANGCQHVPVQITNGKLSDHYDPRKNILRLSPDVSSQSSIASVAIAAHEAGHAIQDEKSYGPLKIRNVIAPVVGIVSNLAWPLLIIGMVLSSAGEYVTGNLLFNLGILFFFGVVLFHLITMPVELNASKRALNQLVALDIIYTEEKSGAKKVLSAAALTYLAALAMAIANLLRILAIRGRN
jgi:Zn-dependent membrane protease YugP